MANKIMTENKKAYFDYFIEEKFEAGIVLTGTEIKSIRAGKCSIKEAYIEINNGEANIIGMNISPYDHGNIFNVNPLRDRKLLLHKSEILKMSKGKDEDGYTLVPTKVYLVKGKAKVEVAIAKGKKLYDKRESIKEKDIKRDMARYSK